MFFALLQLNEATLYTDLWTVLSLFYLVWIFGWAKNALGSAKLAILFAVIVVYLTFFLHPELVWLPVLIIIFAALGKGVFEKANVFKD